MEKKREEIKKYLVDKTPSKGVAIDYQLRPYQANDFEDFFRIHKLSFKDYTDAHRGGWKDTAEYMKAKAEEKEAARLKFMQAVIVKDEAGEDVVAGFYDCHKDVDKDGLDIMKFDYIATDPIFRGCKIASRLIVESNRQADEMGINSILRVFQDNPVQELYKKYGYDYLKNEDGTNVEHFDTTTGEATHFFMVREPQTMEKDISPERV